MSNQKKKIFVLRYLIIQGYFGATLLCLSTDLKALDDLLHVIIPI